MGARDLGYLDFSCSRSLRASSFFLSLEVRSSTMMPFLSRGSPFFISIPAAFNSPALRDAVPGGCTTVGETLRLSAAANEEKLKLLSLCFAISIPLHKKTPHARVNTYDAGQINLTRLGERLMPEFVLDWICEGNGILSFLVRHTRHQKAGGLRLAKKAPNFMEHGLMLENARLMLSEAQGLKAWPDPDPYLLDEWGDSLALKALASVDYDQESVTYRMHIMATLLHIEEGYPWLIEALKEKPGYSLPLIEAEWKEIKDLNPGPRYYAQMKPVRPDGVTCALEQKGAIKAPIRIETDRYIATETMGYWETKTDKQGNLKPLRPAYRDLMKRFKLDHPFVTISDSGLIYTYGGTHYELTEPLSIKSYAEIKFNPKPTALQRTEFLSLLKVNELRPSEWFNHGAEGLINLKNGVYDINNSSMKTHSKDHGFRYCLPYDYDPEAECQAFGNFMLDITRGRLDIVSVLQEFMGYAIAGGPCKGAKALILYGGGQNGKSTFMDILKDLAGSDNYSSLSLTALQKDTKRYQVDGKLFNLGEETNVRALGESEVFKAMVTGGEVDVKKLYVQDYSFQNKCKLIMACNELPKSSDKSHGLYRRMLLVPFDARFEGEEKDKFMTERLLKELPGIFNFAMTGYKRLIENKYIFTEGDTLRDALEDYKLENDNVLQWTKDNVIITSDDEDYLFKDEMYKSYKSQCEEDGIKPFAKQNFFKSFKDKYPGIQESKRQGMGLGTSRKRVLLGISKAEL